MLRVIQPGDEEKQRQTTFFIRERPNLIGFCSKLSEKTFEEIRGSHKRMPSEVEFIEGEGALNTLCRK
jgi:hypothetical protein